MTLNYERYVIEGLFKQYAVPVEGFGEMCLSASLARCYLDRLGIQYQFTNAGFRIGEALVEPIFKTGVGWLYSVEELNQAVEAS